MYCTDSIIIIIQLIQCTFQAESFGSGYGIVDGSRSCAFFQCLIDDLLSSGHSQLQTADKCDYILLSKMFIIEEMTQ
jgi:hypothetical protein